jgi:serine protease Do
MTPQAPVPHPSLSTDLLADAVERLSASVVGLHARRGAAAGVLWQAGVVVTSATMVGRHASLQVLLPGGEPVEGTLRGVDASTDLAAITITNTSLPSITLNSAASPRTGDFVFAVGREPSGLVQASFGHVGAAAGPWRSWRGGRMDQLIRLDGGLYPGLAGAAVGDASGRCIGIASPAFSRMHGVVVPVATVARVLTALLAHGRVAQGYLGIAAQTVHAQFDGQATAGLLVSSVAADGPATRAGLLVGDVIVSAGGQAVAQMEALRDVLSQQVGAALAVQVLRGGQNQTLTIQVTERPPSRCG